MTDVSFFEIFFFIFISALFSLGGGNGQIPIIQGQWVEPGILDPGFFSFALAISYLTPGPKAGFIAGIGYYLGGFPGSISAVLGLAIPTCIAASGVSYALDKLKKIVDWIKPSAGFVIAGLIAAAALGTAAPMNLGLLDIIGIIIVALLIAWRSIDPVWLVIGGVIVGLCWSYLVPVIK